MKETYFHREEESVRDLQKIDGIGREIALALVHKGISNQQELARTEDSAILETPGIGPAKLAIIKAQLRIAVDGS